MKNICDIFFVEGGIGTFCEPFIYPKFFFRYSLLLKMLKIKACLL